MLEMTEKEKHEAEVRRAARKPPAKPQPRFTEEQLCQLIDMASVSGNNDQVIQFTQMRDELRRKTDDKHK